MKALTLWEPWASLVIHGFKKYETRSWKPPDNLIDVPIAIHAAKKLHRNEIVPNRYMVEACERMGLKNVYDFKSTLGCVLGIVKIEYVIATISAQTELCMLNKFDELAFGDYSLGRFAWSMKVYNIFPEPVPVRGKQGFWNWDKELT